MNGKTNNGTDESRRIRILIADDSAEFRHALEIFLEQLTHLVEVVGAAEDGEHVLTLLPGTRPDLVLMDLQMPRINGLQATRKIRAEFPGVRVIMITLHDSGMWEAASAAAGADRFIAKHRLHQELPGALAQLFPRRGAKSTGTPHAA
jgi:DNA-binding NarL/FixJ family response regulator